MTQTETTVEIAWDDPRVVALARERCTMPDGSPCEGPENDCDGMNCHAVQQAIADVREAAMQKSEQPADREQRLEDALRKIIERAPTEPAVATGNENSYQIEDIGAHNRHLYLANIARKALKVDRGAVVTETTTEGSSFRMVVNGKDLSYPTLRLAGIFLLAFLIGIVVML